MHLFRLISRPQGADARALESGAERLKTPPSMGRIRVLEERLASQIAAGEVVERPSSVAKELLENALDAGARRVEVVLEGGGIDRLLIADDGTGMEADDATLCFSRHATSKLREIDDLKRIGTFGFRGEALAAIASVAKVRLTTRPKDAAAASEVRCEGGHIVHVGEAGSPPGTRIDVRELFFNVPARRKFLKTPRTEAGHVEQVVRTAALGQPGVAFRVSLDGKVVLDVPGAEDGAPLDHPRRRERAVQCLGKQVREYLFPFEARTDLIRLTGYVVAPLETRRDMSGVNLSVNGRPVTDRGLVQAVRVAFRTLLEVGRQPILALDLEIDPALVDVNVHPRKAEVRFADPRQVHGHLIRLLGDFLATTPWLSRTPARSYSLPTSAEPLVFRDPRGEGVSDLGEVHRQRVRDALERFAASRASPSQPAPAWARPVPPASSGAALAATMSPPVAPRSEPGLASVRRFSELRAVGQVSATYLLLEGPDGLVVIDQHAAHERVVFERLRKAAREGAPRSQPLLFPTTIPLGPLEMAAVEERADALVAYGLELEPFGEGTAILRAVPAGLDAGKAEQIARDALAELAEGGRADSLEDLQDRVCARLACHGSVRAGQALAPEEIRALLRSLDEIDLGAHCPHGRPVVRTVRYDEMAKWFDRE